MKRKNMIGLKFGKLTVIGFSHIGNFRQPYYLCKCDCGKEKIILGFNLRKKIAGTKSCGCLLKEVNSKVQTTHGMSKTRLYYIWDGMKKRCLNKKSKDYFRYGGRGILVCREWLSSINFFEWAQMHGYQENLTIDRINNDGNYEPNNCRWATMKEQCVTRRKGNIGKNSWNGLRTRNVLGQFI